MTMNLAEHLQHLTRGGESAWDTLYDSLSTDVMRTAYRVCGDQHLAQDATQEVFLQLKHCAHRFQGPCEPSQADAAVRAWISGITVKVTLYLLRAQRNQQRRDRASKVPQLAMPKDPSHDFAIRELVRLGLANLPAKLATVVSLRHLEDFSYEEIAQIEGCSPGNARVRCSRGLAKLRSWCARSSGVTSVATLITGLEAAATETPSGIPLFNCLTPTTIPSSTIFGGISTMTYLGLGAASAAIIASLSFTTIALTAAEEHTNTSTSATLAKPPTVSAIGTDNDGRQDLVMITTNKPMPIGAELYLYRQHHYICKARVELSSENMAVCRVIADTWNSEGLVIETGDLATDLGASKPIKQANDHQPAHPSHSMVTQIIRLTDLVMIDELQQHLEASFQHYPPGSSYHIDEKSRSLFIRGHRNTIDAIKLQIETTTKHTTSG